jgi:uncharacterized membrane protein YcaP (DUF421 family)
MSEGFDIILRTLLSFFLILVIARFIGRRTVAQLRFHDFITSTMLGTLAGNLAFNVKIQSGLIGFSMIMLGLISFILVILEMRYRWAREWIDGKPVTIIEDGQFLEESMRKHKFTKDSLLQQLRKEKVFNPMQVEKAILEKSGQLSIMLKPDYQPLTLKTFLETAAKAAPVELIVDGNVLNETLQRMGVNEHSLAEEAKKQGVRLECIEYAVQGTDGRIYFVPRRLSQLPAQS